MPSVQVRGKEKLTKLADVLATHGEGKSIKRLLAKTIRDQSAHITREQRENLAARMPHRGGLAESLAGQGKFSVRTSMSARSAGVTIVDSWKGHDMRAVDSGLIRHPVFGRWVAGQRPQAVPAGLLARPVIRNQLKLRFAIVRSLDELAEKIAKET